MSIRRLGIAFAGSLAVACTTCPLAADGVQVIEVQAADPGIRQRLGVLFGHIDYDSQARVARVEADALGRQRLADIGLAWTVDAQRTAALQAYLHEGLAGLRAIPGYACYRTVEETFDAMAAIAAAHPALAQIVDIGDSWQRQQNPAAGYPIRVLKLGNRRSSIQPKPIFFALSSIHAREYTPAELMMRFAEQLVGGYGTDADATWLLDHNEFHLLLQANPDGRKKAEQQLSWRKNENTTHCPGSFWPWGDGTGVDLNRNFPLGWNGAGGSSGDPCSTTYRGPAPGSEPETRAVTEYLLSIYPDRRPGDPASPSTPADADTQGLFLDMHSYTGLMLWPWGGAGITGNNDAFVHLGRRLAWFNGYEPKQSVELYPTDGTTIDFAYGELGVPAFTYEIGTAFFQSCSSFENTILPDNLASLRYAARTLHAPYRLAAGPDAYDVALSAPSVIQGALVEITATLDDSRYQHGPGAPPSQVQAIASAQLHLDHLPWQSGESLPMSATDGAFDSLVEPVTALLDTTMLRPGRHLLVVQGTDASGQTGPPSAVFLTVEVNADWIFRNDFE